MTLGMPWSVRVHNVVRAIGGAASVRSLMGRAFCGVLATLVLTGVCTAASDSAPVAKPGDYGKIPLSFERNQGQTDARVQFFSRGQGYGLFLTPGEAVLELKKPQAGVKNAAYGIDGEATTQPAPETSLLHMKLMGANLAAPVTAQDLLPGTANYLRGSDPKQWVTDIPTYKRVAYSGVYPGIDLVYYGNQRQLEYDFVVAPGADAKQIVLDFSGAKPTIDQQGNLVLTAKGGETSFHKPVVYQMAGDARIAVEGVYRLEGKQVRFALGNYDHSRPLVIDPVLTYGTFLGGSLDDRGFAIQADAAGNAYIVGDTVSLNFPLLNAIQNTNHNTSNGWVVFITKLNPAGTAVTYSTFLGGVADSHALGMALDASGSVYVAGYTSAGDYPVTAGAFQTVCGANASNNNGVHSRSNGCGPSSGTSGFLSKLSPGGNSLVYSTFLSGNNFNEISGVATNTAGEAYVTGNTNAACGAGPYYPAPFGEDSWDCFPTTAGALQTELNGAFAPGTTIWAFFSKFSADGSSLLYSTLFAAPRGSAPGNTSLANSAYAVAVDASGNGYITGTGGYGLPTTAGAFYVPPANTSNILPPYPAFVAKFNPTLSGSASLVYSTFLGSAAQTANATNYRNIGTGIAVDANGNAIVAGYTQNACGYPTTPGAFQTVYQPGCQDGFVTKLNAAGTGLIWSTLLGSISATASNTQLNSLAVGSNGNIYVAGLVQGGTYPSVNGLRAAASGGSIVSELNSTGSALIFSSYLGSFGTSGYGGTDVATGVATDPNGNMYVTGRMDSNTLTIPTTPGALQPTYNGGSYDAFVLKIAPFATSTTTLSLSSASVNSGQPVTLTATVAGPSGSPVPTGTVTFLLGSTTLGTGTLDGTGKATYSTSTLSATTYVVTARYAGDTSYSTSTSTAQTLVVNPITTTTALTVTPATAVAGTSVSISAKVTPASGSAIPTGTVTFKNGTAQIAVIAVDGTGTATFTSTALAVGSYSITAAYNGDSSNASSTSTAGSLTITAPLVATVTTLAASPSSGVTGTSIAITATVTQVSGSVVPTGTATFKEGSTTLGTGTLTAGKVTFTTNTLAVGSHTITASYGGDTGNLASTSTSITVTITTPPAADFTMSATPTSTTGTAGASQVSTIAVTPVNGFNSATSLTCSGLPSHSTCTFNPASVTPTGTTAATSTLTIATNVQTAAIALPVFSGQHPIANAGILASLLLLPLAGSRNRKMRKMLAVNIVVLIATLTAIGTTGCAVEKKTTPSGTYAITVTGTSGSLTHNATFTVTIQ